MADRQPHESELLGIAVTLLTEIHEWVTAQLLSAPDRGPEPSENLDPAQYHEAMRRRFERDPDNRGARQHNNERQLAYRERFSERMTQLYDGLVVCGIHPDVTRPKYEQAGGNDLAIEMVMRDLELIVLRLEARLGRK